MNTLRDISQHFLQRLRETPLLLGWLLVGPWIAFVLDGWLGFAFGLINIFLIVAYAIFIRWMTPTPPVPTPVKRPYLELALALILFGVFLFIQFLDFDVWTIQPWHGWVRGFLATVYRATAGSDSIPEWARNDLYGAVSSTIKQLRFKLDKLKPEFGLKIIADPSKNEA